MEESGEVTTETTAAEGTSMETTEELPESTPVETQTSTEIVDTTEEETAGATEAATTEAAEEVSTEIVTTEEVTTEVATTEEALVEATIEEETTEAVEAVDVKATEDTVLTLGETVDFEVSTNYNDKTWLKYTVETSGYYNLKLENSYSSSIYTYVYKNSKTGNYDYYNVYSNTTQEVQVYFEAGEVIHIGMYTNSTAGSLSVTLSKIVSVTASEGEDGVYTGEYGDYTVTTTINPGYTHLNMNIALEAAGETELSDYYYYVTYFIRKVSTDYKYSSNGTLASYDGYSTTFNVSSMSKNSSYTVDILLKNGSRETVAVFTGMTFQTRDTDQPAVLSIEDVTYNSATIKYEQVQSRIYAYYAPENSTEKYSLYTGTNTCSYLAENTKYLVWVEDEDGNVLLEDSFTTKTSTLTATYTLTATGPTKVNVVADVTGASEQASNAYVFCQYTDTDGTVRQAYGSEYYKTDEETGEKTANISFDISGLTADTTYSFELWLQEVYYNSDAAHYQYEKREVATLTADYDVDEISLTASQNEEIPTSLDYSIVLPKAPESTEQYEVWYRLKQSNDIWTYYCGDYIYTPSTEASGEISGLVEGMEYELQLVLPNQGVEKTTSCQLGTAVYSPQVTDDTDALDADLTYTLSEEEVSADDTYTVDFSYLRPDYSGYGYSYLARDLALDADNGYCIQLNTNDYTSSNLIPDSDYIFKWELYKNDTLCHVMLQPVTTKEMTVTATQQRLGANEAVYQIDLAVDKEKLSSSEYIYASLQKADGKVVATPSVYFTKSDKDAKTLTFSKLDPDTEYKVIWTYNDEEIGDALTFTTLEDDRTLSNVVVTAQLNSIRVTGELGGTVADLQNTYIHLYAREKGTTDWLFHDYETYSESGNLDTMTLYGLEKETEYEYAFGIGKSYATTPDYLTQKQSGTITTLVDDRTLTLNSVHTYLNSADLNFTLTGEAAKDINNYAHIYYRKADTEDDWDHRYTYKYGENSLSLYVYNLEENTEYEYVYGLGVNSYTAKDELKDPVEGTFTTLADDRTLTFNRVDAYLNNADLNFTIAGEAAQETGNYVLLYYREKGTENEWESEYEYLYGQGDITVSIDSNLTEETTYEYVCGFGTNGYTAKDDLKSSQTGEFKTLADDRTLTVGKVEASLNSVIVTVELTGKAANGTNYILLYYREKGTENDWKYSTASLTGTGETTLTFTGLEEETEYEYVLGLGTGRYTAKDDLKNSQTGEFKTLADDRTLTVSKVEPLLRSVNITVQLAGKAAKGSNYVLLYYREKGTEDYWTCDDVYMSEAGEETFNFSGLKEDTTYEYVLGLGSNWYTTKEELVQSQTGEFATIADNRSLTVDVTPVVHRADVGITLSGKAAEKVWTNIVVYYKEKDAETEQIISTSMYGQGSTQLSISSFNGAELKENTVYEYTIGYTDSYPYVKEELKSSVTGTFTTQTDSRKLTNVGCQAGYESARIGATVANNSYGIDSYVHYFYKEKNTEQWQHSSSHYGTYVTKENSLSLYNLKQGTEYEYVVALTDGYSLSSPDEVTKETHKVTGTFATKVNKYKLNIVPDNAKTTYSKGYVNVTASGDNYDERLYVTLYFANGQTIVSESVTLSQMQGYKNTAVLTGLTGSTEYTLTQAAVSVDENGNRIQIAELTPEVKFTTKAVVEPATVQLPVERLYLNAAGGGDYISAQKLNAKVTPVKALAALTWTSSDEKVATVSSTGYVQAVGTGKAVITVASAYDETINDTCEVIVENYVIAKENEAGTPEVVTENVTLYEDDSLSGYGLYESDLEGNLTKLDVVNVSVEKSIVAEWNSNTLTEQSTLTATAVGNTKVYFEAAGVKAVMNLMVLNKAKGFGLTGLRTSDETYPAISLGSGKYEIAKKAGLTYTVVGEITPQQTFEPSEFVWTSSNTEIATVENGVITPVAAGSVTITATPVGETSPYVQKEASIGLDIKELPVANEDIPTVYAVMNVKAGMLLEDVSFPEEWGTGWEWRDPKTPLYTLPVNTDAYEFEAYYAGNDMYAYEGLVRVYISNIELVYAYEVNGDHNNVIETDGKDTIYLRVSESHMGTIPSNYRFTIPAVDGLTIEYNETLGQYAVTAQNAGDYVLTPTIEFIKTDSATGAESVICAVAGSYSLKATEKAQVSQITFDTDSEDVEYDEETSMIKMNFTDDAKGKKFTLSAKAMDQNGNELTDTPIQWKTTDKTVATVSYSKSASHEATITVKGTGHTVLTVTAGDTAGYTTQLDVEFRDYQPRINTSKATVNIAYDYDNSYGKNLAEQTGGVIELAQVYGDEIQSVKLVNKDGSPVSDLKAEYYGSNDDANLYVIRPTKAEIDKSKKDYTLEVTTSMSKEPYTYPLKVSVVDNAPKVTAKMGTKLNLFYKTVGSNLWVKVSGVSTNISSVGWSDNSADAAGFKISSWSNDLYSTGYRVYVYQDDVKVISGKLADPAVATGTLTVKLYGVRKPIEIKNVKIGYNYKKPSLKLYSSTTNISPETGNTSGGFYIYDPLKKNYVSYSTNANSYRYYNEFSYDSDDVTATPSGAYIYTNYTGTNKKETVTYKLDSRAWREPLTIKQTIKVVSPKATMKPSTLTYNKSYKSTVSTSVYVGNISTSASPEWLDLEVKGVNDKSKALVENDIFDITRTDSASSPVTVTLNQTELLELDESNDLKAGTYSFKVTPYYRNKNTGEKVSLNTLTMKLKVVDKPVTVKITPKGSLDLSKGTATKDYWYLNSICLQSKFNNLGSNYWITNAELKGEYSKYYKLIATGGYYYLKIADDGKLKANQKYKLSVEYTIQVPNGDTFTVESNVFTVKPKQTAPKVTVYGNNQTLYAASDVSRYLSIYVPSYYTIEDVYGSLDCNKDGKEDIEATTYYMSGRYAGVKVRILDHDAVNASAKGKTYTIPLTVKIVGRDGISRDAKVNIKVKVKR